MPPLARNAFVDELGVKYLWWSRDRIEGVAQRRIIAQIMDLGTLDDWNALRSEVGDEALRDAVQHAEAGWFRPRSWSYWHVRLGLRAPGTPSPPMPVRRTH